MNLFLYCHPNSPDW